MDRRTHTHRTPTSSSASNVLKATSRASSRCSRQNAVAWKSPSSCKRSRARLATQKKRSCTITSSIVSNTPSATTPGTLAKPSANSRKSPSIYKGSRHDGFTPTGRWQRLAFHSRRRFVGRFAWACAGAFQGGDGRFHHCHSRHRGPGHHAWPGGHGLAYRRGVAACLPWHAQPVECRILRAVLSIGVRHVDRRHCRLDGVANLAWVASPSCRPA